MQTQNDEASGKASADLLMALVLVALGLAVFYFSWTMPRLEVRRIHPSTIPGLVPIFLGAGIALCGALLAWRSYRLLTPGSWAALGRILTSFAARRALIALAMGLFYALVLVGTLPFWAASGLFIFSFIVVFEVWLADPPTPLWRSMLWAALIAAVAGGGIYFVFARIFLVRLP